ncbi:retrovirus-related pol polyprotein from transposon TNT 1-94 [Tanacetum coccineum]
MKVKGSLNMTFDETPPPPKTSPLKDDDLVEEEANEVNKTKPLGNYLEDKSLENNEIINIKESKSHPLDNVIGDSGNSKGKRLSISMVLEARLSEKEEEDYDNEDYKDYDEAQDDGLSSTSELHFPSQTISTRNSSHNRAAGWDHGYGNGKPRMADPRLPPSVDVIGAHNRLGHETLTADDQLSFNQNSMNFPDQFQNLLLVLDTSSSDLAFRDRDCGVDDVVVFVQQDDIKIAGKKLSEHIDEFNKLIHELVNIDVDIDDEDHALMLLTSLPSSYDNFVETLLYGRELLTLEDGRSDHRGNQGHGSSRSKSKGKGTYKLKCYICYSADHLKKDCPKRIKKKSTSFVKKNAGQCSGMHFEGYENGDLLMALSEEMFLKYIMDSGDSYHMTPRRDLLFDFKEFNGGTVLLGDNRACSIRGTGKMRVQMKDGSSFVLENVIKGSLMVLSRNIKENYVYSLDGWAESGKASVGIQEKESLAHVWHKRLGHISEAGLHELERRKGVIDYVHADLWGPSWVESISGCRYFLLIIDDYSRRVWVHFLRHKNEAFSKFKEWKQLVENHTCRKRKKLQTNNGLEFCNQEFHNLCKESGIARHLTSGLPDSFWAEATVTTAYLINRSPSTALEKNTPMDLWSRHLANYEMLRIFGCDAYAHVNQGKLKPRVIKCIFMGYPDGMNGYKLWMLDNVKPKIIISRDMTFNECLMYKDKGASAIYSGKEVEFEVELQGSRVELTVDPHTGENPGNEDEEKDKGPQQQNMENYVLLCDGAKRTTTIPIRYRDEGNVSLSRLLGSREEDNMTAYAFAIAEEEDTHEPITYQEAINSSENNQWVRAMEKKMSSLKKNHTWELVDQPLGQKLNLVLNHERATSNRFSCICYDSCVYFKEFAPEFDMKEPGPARKILGMEIVRDRGSQTLKCDKRDNKLNLLILRIPRNNSSNYR